MQLSKEIKLYFLDDYKNQKLKIQKKSLEKKEIKTKIKKAKFWKNLKKLKQMYLLMKEKQNREKWVLQKQRQI